MSSEQQNSRPNAFVIMPFASEFTVIYESLIKPALEESGYNVRRADSFLDQQNILRSIVKGITTARLVIAELTTLNPNVFYELGLCHGLKIPTILLAQSINEVPFDLRGYTIQIYSTHFNEVLKLKIALKEIAEKHLRGEIIFGNPITDFFSESQTYGEPNTPNQQELLGINLTEKPEQDKGILEAHIASRAFLDNMEKLATALVNTMNKISPLLNRLDEITKETGPGNARTAQTIAEEIAQELDSCTEQIKRYPEELLENINTPMGVFINHLITLDSKSEKSREELTKSRLIFSKLAESIPVAIQGTSTICASISNIGLRSGIIMPASRRSIETIRGMSIVIEQLEALCQRIVQICDEKLNYINEE